MTTESIQILDRLTADDPELREDLHQFALRSSARHFTQIQAVMISEWASATNHWMPEEEMYQHAAAIWRHLRRGG
ncbi:hypothetical protein [uncultured Thiodictyon sp.]|uniref:hypothetical protein n=1 Tax=uncultured Thiodictyon sp. TaxID=1846217 RepID=UPI0025D2B453|nr:hypothetical protein [uncultured Thiodictyon sp.]